MGQGAEGSMRLPVPVGSGVRGLGGVAGAGRVWRARRVTIEAAGRNGEEEPEGGLPVLAGIGPGVRIASNPPPLPRTRHQRPQPPPPRRRRSHGRAGLRAAAGRGRRSGDSEGRFRIASGGAPRPPALAMRTGPPPDLSELSESSAVQGPCSWPWTRGVVRVVRVV